LTRASGALRIIQKAFRLSVFDWWLLFAATLNLARAAVLLRNRPVSDVVLMAEHRVVTGGKCRQQPGSAVRVGMAIQVAARIVPWKADCLIQAVAASHLLRRHGLEPQIRIGVRRDGRELLGHAWVDCDGATVVGARGDEFTPMREATSGHVAALQTNIPSWI
jgi:hypothetical protein